MRTLPTNCRRHALAVAAMLCLGAATGQAQTSPTGVLWADWASQGPGSVVGQMAMGGADPAVTVRFSGDYHSAFTTTFPEPYWGPDSTYTGGPQGPLANAPQRAGGGIFIAGGPGRFVLSFSEAVTNPVIAIASLGLLNADRSVRIQTAMLFEQDHEVLSNGPNYDARDQFSNFTAFTPRQLYGAESSGVIRFNGTFTELAWTSPVREENAFGNLVGTYLVSVGHAGCNNHELKPNPLQQASRVRVGCSAYTVGSFVQAAQLDVAGSLRAERFDVQAGQTLNLSGSFNASRPTVVAGRLLSTSGSQLRSGGMVSAWAAAVSVVMPRTMACCATAAAWWWRPVPPWSTRTWWSTAGGCRSTASCRWAVCSSRRLPAPRWSTACCAPRPAWCSTAARWAAPAHSMAI